MTKQEAIHKIREKCIEANPLIRDGRALDEYGHPKTDEIRLADVLYAVGVRIGNRKGMEGYWIGGDWVREAVKGWKLTKDSLDEQSDEAVLFLAELLK